MSVKRYGLVATQYGKYGMKTKVRIKQNDNGQYVHINSYEALQDEIAALTKTIDTMMVPISEDGASVWIDGFGLAPIDFSEGNAQALWDELAKQPGWELDRGVNYEVDGYDEYEDHVWRVHEVRGGINDREWYLIGHGETPQEAVKMALESKKPKPTPLGQD